jgi:prevent-host-death family protein
VDHISALELRKKVRSILERVNRGERIVITYRGNPVARLEPIETPPIDDDPFYSLAHVAQVKGDPLTNEEMDAIIYDT